MTQDKDVTSYYHDEKVHPFHYISSIYYSGQDVYNRPTQTTMNPMFTTFNKDGREDYEPLMGLNTSMLSPLVLPEIELGTLRDAIYDIMIPFDEASPLQDGLQLKQVAMHFFKDSVVPIIDEWGDCVGILCHEDWHTVAKKIFKSKFHDRVLGFGGGMTFKGITGSKPDREELQSEVTAAKKIKSSSHQSCGNNT